MSSDLAAIVGSELPLIERHFAQLGPLDSIAFMGVGSEGWDLYQAKFENGILISRILLGPDGKVSRMRLEWGP